MGCVGGQPGPVQCLEVTVSAPGAGYVGTLSLHGWLPLEMTLSLNCSVQNEALLWRD